MIAFPTVVEMEVPQKNHKLKNVAFTSAPLYLSGPHIVILAKILIPT